MIGPLDVLACSLEVGFERKVSVLRLAQDGVKVHIADLDLAGFVACGACAIGVRRGECAAEGLCGGMGVDDEDFGHDWFTCEEGRLAGTSVGL